MKLNQFAPKKNMAQAMVEFAIVLPVLLLLLYGLLEAGRLLFMYSTIVTASRQAVRYGSATGIGTGTTLRYNDCIGIRAAASKVDYLRAFDHTVNTPDIEVWWDLGNPSTTDDTKICKPGETTANWTPTNESRLIVKVTGHFNMIVKLVPFGTRTIEATSARSILASIPIEVTGVGGTPAPTSIFTPTDTATPTATFTPTATSIYSPTPSSTATATHIPNTPTYTVSPSSTPSFGLKVQLQLGGTDNNQQSQFNFKVVNTGSAAASNITVRLYFTTDGSNPVSNYVLEKYWESGVSSVSGPTLVSGSTYYYAVNYGAASLPAGSAWEYKSVLHLSGWTSTYSGANDWWHTTGTLPAGYADWATIPAYIGGIKVWGDEPPIPVTTPTPVLGCGNITTDALNKQGSTMRLVIHNPNSYTISVQNVFVVWNHDFGHKTSGLKLKVAEMVNSAGTLQFWASASGQTGPTLTINPAANIPPAFVLIPPGDSTVIFTFDQSYTTWDTTEEVLINLSTPGCELFPIDRKNLNPQ